MANLIDFNINQFSVMIPCVHIMDVYTFPKDGSRYISALKKFVYFMPTFSDRG